MFFQEIGQLIPEVSHKRIEHPIEGVYFNHIHNHCEILLFLCGEAKYNIDGQILTPRPYDVLFIPAATYHYLIPTASVPYENYVIGIDPTLMEPVHYDKLFTPPLMLHLGEEPELMELFSRLDRYERLFSKQDFSEAALAVIRELVLCCSYRKDELQYAAGSGHGHVEEIIRYISEHLEEPLDADRIAAELLLSKSYIQNMFSQSMHIGLKAYILQKKIYAAHADLRRGMSPGTVCEKYCFGDYSGFYRLYKKTFSVAPRANSAMSVR